jgi:hypothetical protein
MREKFSALSIIEWIMIALSSSCIVYGLGAALLYKPETWSYIAGPLFTLSSGLLFVVALLLQNRGNKETRKMVLLSVEEKEFNVCLVAIKELREQIEGLQPIGQNEGVGAIQDRTDKWVRLLNEYDLINDPVLAAKVNANPMRIDEVQPDYRLIEVLLVKAYWVRDAVVRKKLSAVDRQYLSTMSLPLFISVHTATVGNLLTVVATLDNVLAYEPQPLPSAINYKMLRAYRANFQHLVDWSQRATEHFQSATLEDASPFSDF